ncbi:MAG: hypothetical protein ACOYNP_18970 [Gemmataceae bacterium]
MMKSQSGSPVEDTNEKYAYLGFASFCKLHKIPGNESQQWNFDEKNVLAFLPEQAMELLGHDCFIRCG